jgi:DNA-binding MarR family transcriptional regulator
MNRRAQIIEMIRTFWEKHGCAPTEREIAEEIGVTQNTVHYHIDRLVKSGQLLKITAGHRSLALPKQTQSAV